jgi:hypothetical protein
MDRIYLRVYLQPSYVEGFLNISTPDGSHERLSVTIDTGAAISLFPYWLLGRVAYRLTETPQVSLQQAGLTKHSFEATEAYIRVFMEDWLGHRSREFEIRAWFAETSQHLLGFDGVLDQANLAINMLNTRQAWVEFPSE